MKRKLTVILMAIVMLVAYMPIAVSPVSAWSDGSFKGKECVKDSYAASAIDYVMARYPIHSTWKGSGQCWGYAERVCDILGASTSTKYYTGKKLNKKNVKELLVGVKAGTHVRMGRDNKSFNAWNGHSIVIFKCTEKEVIWADNNRSGENIIDYHRDSFDEFVGLNYDYIHMVKKVTKYNKYYTPQLAAKNGTDGIKVTWTKTPGAKKYAVYRAYSEYGTYKKIGSTKKYNYTDTKAPLGKTCYYKVKAITSSGNRISNVDSGKKKLKPVSALTTTNVASSGKIKLSWKKVKGATSYKIYRLSNKTYKWVKIKTTTHTSFIDNKANKIGYEYDYMVKAYSSKAKTTSSEVITYGTRSIARPTNVSVSLVTKNKTQYPNITWKKVSGASGYEIYRSESKNGYYDYVGSTKKTSFIDKDDYYMNLYDTRYYYKVVSYKTRSYYDYTYTVATSAFTPAKSIKMPKAPEPDPDEDAGYDMY